MKFKNTHKQTLKEIVTPEAVQLHSMTSCGQDAAQDFFDEHNIDAKKLIAYVQQNKRINQTLVYDVRDYISGAKGTVGGEKNLRDRFIKQFQIREHIMKKSAIIKIMREELQALKEAVNPELDRTVNQFVTGLAKKYQHPRLDDAVMAIFEAMKRLGFIDKSVDYKAVDTLSEGSFSDQMTTDTKELYQEYSQKIDIFDRNAINNHDTLDKVMLKDPHVQKSSQKRLLQTALGWAITFAEQMER